MAEKLKGREVFQLLCMVHIVFFLFVLSVNALADVPYERAVPLEGKTTSVWLTKIRQSGQSYWGKLRETLGRGHSHFFPPNIDFSGKESDDAAMGAGEKVKEAAVKSFEKSKEMAEETASEVAEAVKEKVKKSVSGRVTTAEL